MENENKPNIDKNNEIKQPTSIAPNTKGGGRAKKPKINIFKLVRNIIIVIVMLLLALFILDKAPNYKNREITDRTNVIINNKNITAYLKKDLVIDNDYVYLSKQDISNFFDPYLYYNDNENRIVITYDTKVTNMFLNNTSITVNDVESSIAKPAFMKEMENITDGTTNKESIIYIPVSELQNSLNMELKYNKNTDIITIDTLSKEQIKAKATKKISVKSIKDNFSRTVAKVKKNEEVIVIEKDDEKGWTKIRTQDGIIGYVHTKKLGDEQVTRTATVEKPQIEGKINMVWDNFYDDIPNRVGTTIDGVNVISPRLMVLEKLGKGDISTKTGSNIVNYISWAKENNYKVWGFVANDSMIETTSEILNSYELRNKLINNILNYATEYKLDGINIDFENMYQKDKDMFTQFIVELYPRLKEKNMVLSVDVTAPDGGENWSMCYDRHDIANNCDYIIFMAYDQYGEASTTAGTTAGLNWIKIGLNKFLKTEEIDSNKIILGVPFYTRLWTENSNGKVLKRSIVNMKSIKNALPNSAYENKTWLEDLGQYYVEYKEAGRTKKMWIEDERSITKKLNLIKENNLAGAAFWAKDRESDNIWEVIKNELS